MKSLDTILLIVMSGVAFKALLVGSSYSFYKRLKYGKQYTEFYDQKMRELSRYPKF